TWRSDFVKQAPVFTLYCQPCHGQVTTSPSSSPSPSGPPRWRQVLSMTWNAPLRLKTAYSFPFTLATIPAPGATSAVPATRTKLAMTRYLLLALFFFAAIGFFLAVLVFFWPAPVFFGAAFCLAVRGFGWPGPTITSDFPP